MSVLEFTSFITPDGVEYKFDDTYRFLMTEEGLGMPPIEYITQKSPFQHGETVINYRLQKRIIQVLFRQNGYSRPNYWANRSLLINALRPNRNTVGNMNAGVLRKIFQDGTIRDINVVIDQGPVFKARDISKWDEYGFTETLRFIAHDPTFYDPAIVSYTWNPLKDPDSLDHLIFPFSFPFELGSYSASLSQNITYTGTWIAYPKITLTGPMREFEIHNTSTGEDLWLRHDLVAGETVTIDMPFGNKTIVSNLGMDLSGSIDGDFMTFHIAPEGEVVGGVNVLTILSTGTIDATSSLSFQFYKRYIGI